MKYQNTLQPKFPAISPPQHLDRSQKNTFLEKLNPSLSKPAPKIPATTPFQWRAECLGVMGLETLKAIGRADLISTYDALSIPVGLATIGSVITQSISWFAQSPSLARAVIATTCSGGALIGVPALWAGAFYQIHHNSRKNQDRSKEASTLSNPKEIQDISFETKRIIHQTALQLFQEYPHISPDFISAITFEVALGNWQVNHAFDKFNSNTKGTYSDIRQMLKQSIPLSQRVPLEQAIQKADFQKVNSLMQKLPTALQNKIKDLFSARLIRNLTCFASRAIREQRDTTTDFESKYMSQWLADYNQLHAHSSNTPIEIKTVLQIMRGAMDSLGWQGVMPLLEIEVLPIAAMDVSSWPKKIERQWMRELNTEHDHKLHNAQNIPQNGRAIVAFNHSLFTFDIGMGLEAIRKQRNREPTMVIDMALMVIAVVNSLLHSAGYRVGDRENFASLLTTERLMAVAPGGSTEALKPYDQANQLYWSRAKGFVRAHATTGAPIIGLMSPQADQLRKNILPLWAHRIQKSISKMFKLPILPPILAPLHKEQVRVDHFATQPFEAPPMPIQNATDKDPRFFHHVNKIHAKVFQECQELLITSDQSVRQETQNNAYPLAQLT